MGAFTSSATVSVLEITEPPRCYLAVGRDEEAISLLGKATFRNGLPISSIRNDVIKSRKEIKNDVEKKAVVLDLISTPNMRKKTVLMCFN